MKKARSSDRKDPVVAPAKAAGAASPGLSAGTPAVGRYTAPTAFFILLAILAYLGQSELGYNHGLFAAGVYEPYTDFRSIPKIGGPSPVDAGRDVYSAAGCVACHQPNGSGNPANGCPPLAKSDWVLEEGAGRLIRLVLQGGQGPITVNGQTWNGNMTPFGAILSDEQIANVLTFIRQSPEWGNNAGEVTPEMVKAVREKTATRTSQWTPAELLKISATE